MDQTYYVLSYNNARGTPNWVSWHISSTEVYVIMGNYGTGGTGSNGGTKTTIDNGRNTDWKSYRTSIDAIEAATGYDLLSNVSSGIQRVVEAQVGQSVGIGNRK
jgi:DNA/RNA endonuclease G (NUC1)